MNQWLDNYGYLLVILAAVCVVFVIILYFAAKAYRKRTALYKAEETEIKRLVALKEKFRPVTKDAIENASADELLEGIALSYQLTLQKEEDIEGRFNLLNDDVKDVYALDVFVQDKTSKEFFSQNGAIIKDRIIPALEKIGMTDLAEGIKPIHAMYDNSNEDVSYDIAKIEEFDNFMKNSSVLEEIKLKSAEYIKQNFESFIN